MPFDGTKLSQVASDLITARDILIEQGWGPEAGKHGGPHCPVTALMEAVGFPQTGALSLIAPLFSSRFRHSYEALREELSDSDKVFMAVPCWNVVQKSGEPALKLFDRAISKLV
jgi:hypothetical protein